jgi:HSP20 family molecular chaperone IbpA
VGPPPLDACTSSSSTSSIESVGSTGSLRNSIANGSTGSGRSSDFHGHSYLSTFSSYASNGLGSAYARPTPPYLALHMNTSSRPPSMHSSSFGYHFSPPEPPIILPELGDDQYQTDSLSQNDQRRAPHVLFLSHGPPLADSCIEAETTLRDYRLLVRLPGFTRDAITLSSKRRRILHIVADRWEGVGGHFERRVSFGHDADLVQVRAEFDGEMLRIVVPRKPMSSCFVAANS